MSRNSRSASGALSGSRSEPQKVDTSAGGQVTEILVHPVVGASIDLRNNTSRKKASGSKLSDVCKLPRFFLAYRRTEIIALKPIASQSPQHGNLIFALHFLGG